MTLPPEKFRALVYETALKEIVEIATKLRPCDLAMAAVYRRLVRAMIEAWPPEPPPGP